MQSTASRPGPGLTYPDIARIFGTGLISTGFGLLVFVLVTITWGDPFTRLAERSEQKKLSRQFAALAPDTENLNDARLDPALTRLVATRAKRQTKLGAAAGEVRIPKIGVRKVLIHGARDGTSDLTKGPGLYQGRPFPGSGAPVAIAGHRTTYGAPFLNVDKLRRGDAIVVTMPYGRFTYTVQHTRIVDPKDWSILDYGAAERTAAARQRVGQSRRCNQTCEHLVLTACHPKYSAAQRIAVLARLSKVELTTKK